MRARLLKGDRWEGVWTRWWCSLDEQAWLADSERSWWLVFAGAPARFVEEACERSWTVAIADWRGARAGHLLLCDVTGSLAGSGYRGRLEFLQRDLAPFNLLAMGCEVGRVHLFRETDFGAWLDPLLVGRQ